MANASKAEFELRVLPHLAAGYSLARWLLRHPQDAEDAVQDSVLKAYRAFDRHTGDNTAAWFLAIVRNTCLTLLDRRRGDSKIVMLEESLHSAERQPSPHRTPPALLQDEAMIAEETRRQIHAALATLPTPLREVVVLREFHDLPYRDIAEIIGTPIGTVMSRLARARERLKAALNPGSIREENGKSS
ncbi:MAG: sigma-70 family RNA polymerase sigma factor [Hyphomicrobiaceae bacterium]